MVSIVAGAGVGLANTSREVVGAGGELGRASTGRAAEQVTVNAANGNLVVQHRDDTLVGVGSDVQLLRSYNSLGAWDGDNADNWRIGYYRKVYGLSGAVNTAGSSVKRIEADGFEASYTYDAARGAYVNTDGAGQYRTLSATLSTGSSVIRWSWTDGDSGRREDYEATSVTGDYRLATVRDRDGTGIDVVYNAAGLIATLSTRNSAGATGDVVTLIYDANKRLQSASTSYQDSTGVTRTRTVSRYDYDTAGRLKTVTTDLTPDDSNVIDGQVYVVSYDYDAAGRLTKLSQTDGSVLLIDYDTSGRVKTVTDNAGPTRFSYDTSLRTTTVLDALGQSTVLAYDTQARLTEVRVSASSGNTFTQKYRYDAVTGDLLQSVDAMGRTTNFTYDARGALIQSVDSLGSTLRRTYSASGLLQTETVYASVVNGTPQDPRVTTWVYDSDATRTHQVRFQVDPQGRVTQYIWGSDGLLQQEVRYSARLLPTTTAPTLSNLQAWVKASAVAEAVEVTAYIYDSRGQLRTTSRYANATNAALTGQLTLGSSGISTQATLYDTFGRLLTMTDASGVSQTYTYDGLNRLTLSKDTNQATTAYLYDDANRKTSVRLANGQTTVQLYDTQGRLVSSDTLGAATQQALGTTRYFYDAIGQLRRVQDATGAQTWTLYDASGLKSADIAANGQLTEYLYDGSGRLIQQVTYATLLSASTLAGLSDAAGQPVAKTVAQVRPVTDLADRIITSYYDAAGRLAGTLDAVGYLSQNVYDATGALIAQTRYALSQNLTRLDVSQGTVRISVPTLSRPESSADDRVTRYLYDAPGQKAARVDGDGGLTLWRYDAAGHMTSQLRRSILLSDTQRTSATLSELQGLAILGDDELTQWIYDGQGRQIGQVDAEGTFTETRYDDAGRVSDTLRYLTQAFRPITASTPTAAASNVRWLTRADLDILRPALGTPLTASRRYNNLGLLAREIAADGTVTTYDYDDLQRLKSTTRASGTPEARTQRLDYDNWGRLGASSVDGDALGVSYTYDAAGRRTRSTDARGNTTVYYYDTAGRQVYAILRDPSAGGEVTETLYSSFSEVQANITHAKRLSVADTSALAGGLNSAWLDAKVAALADASDNRTTFSYNSRGLVRQAVDALGAKTVTAFNAFGEVKSVTTDVDMTAAGASPRTLTTTYTYDRRGQSTQVSRMGVGLPIPVTTGSAFDALGRLSSTTDELNQVTNYSYQRNSGAGRQVTVSDPAGATVTTYDALDRVVSRRDRVGNTVTYVHDAVARKLTITTAERVTLTTEYNRHGQVAKLTDAAGSTTYVYDSHGNLTTVTDALGNVTQNAYDLADNLTRVTQGANATSFTYDAANRVLTQTVDPDGLKLKTTYAYDGQGRRLSITDPRGAVTTQTFTARGELKQVVIDDGGLNLKTSYIYDAQGRMLTAIEGDGTAAARKTVYAYDVLGRVTSQTVDPDGAKLKTAYTYDAAGHVTQQRNALDQVEARYRYDAAGRLLDRIDATGAVTRNLYDAEGRLTGQIAPATRLAATWSAATDADLAIQITAVLVGGANVELSRYDKDGRLTHRVNAAGESTQFTYDGANRVVQTRRYATRLSSPTAAVDPATLVAALAVSAADQLSTTTYDALGRVTYSVDATGAVTAYGYDNLGHVTRQTRYATRVALPLTLNTAQDATADIQAKLKLDTANDRTDYYAYDATGRERFHVDAEAYITETAYDDASGTATTRRYANRLAAFSAQPALATFTSAVLTSLGNATTDSRTLDRAGRLAIQVDGAGSVTRTTYDAANRISTVTVASGTAQARTTRYGYNAAGQRVSVTRGDGTALASTTRYEYDSLGRLAREIDARGVALAEGNGSWEQAERARLGFPADLGILGAEARAAAQAEIRRAFTTEYGYDAAGRVVSTTRTVAYDAAGWRTSAAVTTEVSRTVYDAFGNAVLLTDARGGKRYQVYDKANRLAQSIDAERYLNIYAYDAFGNLTSTLRVDAKVQGTLAVGVAVAITSTAPAGGAAYVALNATLDHTSSTTYHAANRILTSLDGENYWEGTSQLDAFGQRLNVTNKLGATASYTYDRLGRLLTETLPVQVKNASGALVNVVNAYMYDSRGNRTTSIEAQGLAEQRTTQMVYDGANRLTQRIGMAYTAMDSTGATSTVTPADTWRYDALGQLVEQVSHGVLNSAGAVTGGKRSLAYYDALGQKTLEISADRVASRFSYDAAGNQVAQTIYATRLGATVPLDTATAPAITTDAVNDRTLRTAYDAQGRKILTSLDNLLSWDSGDGSQLVIGGLTPQNTVLQRLFYDAAGNLTERKDGRGNSSFEYFDGLGRRTLSVDAGGATTSWEYGRAGAVATRETRYAGLLPAGFARRQPDISDGSEVAVLRSVAAASQMADSRITDYTLDRLDRVTEKRIGNVAQDAIDSNGQRTQLTTSAITQYQYNGLGAVTQSRQLASQVGSTQTWEQTDFRYDALGREISREAPQFIDWEGASVRPTTDVEYDGLGNVRRRLLRGKVANFEGDDRITRYGYDGNGLLAQVTDAAGAVMTYSYDAVGNVSRRTNKAVRRADLLTSRDVITSFDYDAAGHVTVERRWESDKASAVDIRKTRYNAFGEVAAKGIGDGWEEFAEYTTLGKVAKTNSGDGAIKFYTYDAAGNVTREIRGNGDASVDLRAMTLQQASISTKMYSRVSVYNARNLLVQTIDPQIDVLKNAVTMSSVYSQQWVPAWSPPTFGITSGDLPDGNPYVVSGSAPKIYFSAGRGSALYLSIASSEAAIDTMPWNNYVGNNVPGSAWGTGNFVWDFSSIKGAGKKYIRYVVFDQWDGGPIYAARTCEITVDVQGNITLNKLAVRPSERQPVRVLLPGDASYPNRWINYYGNLKDASTGEVLQTLGGELARGSQPGEVYISQYRPASGSRQLVLDYQVSGLSTGSGGGRVYVTLNANNTASLSSSADPSVQPVRFYVLNRNVARADISFAGSSWSASGSYYPPTNGQPGYTEFTVNATGRLSQGSTYDYVVTARDANGNIALNEAGDPIRQTGRIVMGDGSSLPQVQQQITVLASTEKVTIKRFQSYNAFGEVSEERDERVGERMLASLNEDRRLKGQSALSSLTAEQQAAARTTLQYNTLGLLIAKIDPETFVTAENGFRYRARPLTRYGYDLLGRHTTTTDANGNFSRAYYQAGAADEATAAAFDAAGGTADTFNQNVSSGAVTRYDRDIFGDVRRITDALDNVVLQDYDQMGRLVTVTRVDVLRYDFQTVFNYSTGLGTLTYNPINCGSYKDSYTYDELGQRTSAIYAQPTEFYPSIPLTTLTDYDALGRIVKTVTKYSATTEYVYTLKQASDNAIQAMAGAVSATSGTLAAAAFSGGYIVTTKQADGRSQTDERDYFGHTTRHTDLSGAVFTYSFNSAGQLARETSTVHTGQAKGKDVSYTYYANGYLQALRDNTLGTSGEYAYDNAGNRTYEAYFKLDSAGGKDLSKGAVSYQNGTIVYDELNRIVRVSDPIEVDIRYEYDAMGNRRLVDSIYWDNAALVQDRQTYWYAYDALNRFTITKGQLQTNINGYWVGTVNRATSQGDTSVRVGTGTEGTLIGYDKMSRRASAEYVYNGAAIREVYGYSSDGYLQTTTQNGVLTTVRGLDPYGRTTRYRDVVNNQDMFTYYDEGGRIIQQFNVYAKEPSKNSRIEYTYYDNSLDTTSSRAGKGALGKVESLVPNTGALISTSTYTYDYWDGAQQKAITKSVPNTSSGITTLTYNANGHLLSKFDAVANETNTYTTTASGLILTRTRSAAARTSRHYFYYANDNRVGDVGDTPDEIQRVSYAEQLANKGLRMQGKTGRTYERYMGTSLSDYPDMVPGDMLWSETAGRWEDHYASTADFDQNYEPINDNYPGNAETAYTVRLNSESLYSVAQTLWGDRSMWYLLAESNGLRADSVLKAGQILVVPNKVTNIHNTSDTWRPYNAGEAIGATDPTTPVPPAPKKGCGAIGTILMVVVAAVATVYTAGAAGAYFGAAGAAGAGGFAGGLAVLTGAGGLSAAAIGAAAVGAAVGSIASQAVGLAIGQIDSFSWRSVGQAAVGGAITAGVGAAISSAGGALASTTSPWAAAGRAAIGTGVNLALHNDWSWQSVMISAVSAGVGSAVGSAVGGQAWAQAGNGLGQRMASGLAGSLVARALTGGGRASYDSVFASTLGNAIGGSINDAQRAAAMEADQQRAGREDAAAQRWAYEQAQARSNGSDDGLDLPDGMSYRVLFDSSGRRTASVGVATSWSERSAGLSTQAAAGGMPMAQPTPIDLQGQALPQLRVDQRVLVAGSSADATLEVPDYDALGNLTGYTTRISTDPLTMSYGDQMRRVGQVGVGFAKALPNVPSNLINGVTGLAKLSVDGNARLLNMVGVLSDAKLNAILAAQVPQAPMVLEASKDPRYAAAQRIGMFGGDVVWGAVAPGAVVKTVSYAADTFVAVRTMAGASEALAAEAVERAALLENPLRSIATDLSPGAALRAKYSALTPESRATRMEFLAEANAARRLQELESSIPGAHFVEKHGAQTTLQAQLERAQFGRNPTTGIIETYPNGNPKIPSSATRFFGNRDQLNAINRAQNIFEITGDVTLAERPIKFDYLVGEGYKKTSLLYGQSYSAQVWFKNSKPITAFPIWGQ